MSLIVLLFAVPAVFGLVPMLCIASTFRETNNKEDQMKLTRVQQITIAREKAKQIREVAVQFEKKGNGNTK